MQEYRDYNKKETEWEINQVTNKLKIPIVRSTKYQLFWLTSNSTYVLFIKTYNI